MNNNNWGKIFWHTMEELPEEKQVVILHFSHGIDVMGYMEYCGYENKDIEFYDSNYDDVLVKENIVAWGEFSFPTDWDYNKKGDERDESEIGV